VVLRPAEERHPGASDVPAGRDNRGGAEDGAPLPSARPEGTPAVASNSASHPRARSRGAGEHHLIAASAPAAAIRGGDDISEAVARGWAASLAAGDVDGVLADAERRGLEATLAGAPAADLAALADAARYRRRNPIARRALLAERARFPSSSRARDAAFLIGRIEDDTPGGGERGIEWYDRYLEEAPAGAYASEALGRKMTATKGTRGIEAARELARDYLRRFPGGTYSAAARALLSQP
jgi:hypothetical protein